MSSSAVDDVECNGAEGDVTGFNMGSSTSSLPSSHSSEFESLLGVGLAEFVSLSVFGLVEFAAFSRFALAGSSAVIGPFRFSVGEGRSTSMDLGDSCIILYCCSLTRAVVLAFFPS